MRLRVPRRISGANPTWLKTKLHACLKSRILPEPCPCLFERLRIWPFPTVRSVGRVVYTFSGRTFCQLAPQKDDYQSAILIIVFFGGAKSLIARKDIRGSARVVDNSSILCNWNKLKELNCGQIDYLMRSILKSTDMHCKQCQTSQAKL